MTTGSKPDIAKAVCAEQAGGRGLWLLSGVALLVLWVLAQPTIGTAQTAATGKGTGLGNAAQASGERAFDIPTQSLRTALAQFGRQAGMQIVFASETSRGLQSNAVTGTMSTRQALARLTVGTAVIWTISGNSVVVEGTQTQSSGDLIGNDGSDTFDLGTIVVAGGLSDGHFNEDTPYETSGSVSHISREQLDRVPATSPGDIFLNTPGVIAAGNRVGTSVNPNIRGMQGMGRVKVTVDGSEQATSSYRGYIGSRDETFIDPDLIGGVDITKGPGGGANGGGIGGTVAVRTLEPQDILAEGKSTGVRIKGSIGGNSTGVPATGTTDRAVRGNGILDSDSFSGSVAVATVTDRFELLAAYSRRVEGNYFAGKNAPDDFRFPGEAKPNSIVPPGEEVFNTSQDTRSLLLKAKGYWGDGHSLQLGYSRYDSEHGETIELFFAPWLADYQRTLSQTTVDTYTAKYQWRPSSHDWIDLRANLWMSDLYRAGGLGGILGTSDSAVRTWGGDIRNIADVTTGFGALVIETGLNFTHEDSTSGQWQSLGGRWESAGPSGVRKTFGAYANVTAQVSDRVEVTGGLRYDYYTSRGKGYLADYPDRSESKLSPNLGVTFTPTPGVQLFALYKEGFRAPSLRETHWNYQDLLINNPNLLGEKARTTELGVNMLRDGVFRGGDSLRLKGVFFQNKYDDYIVRESTGTRPGYQTPYHWGNIDQANFRGFELSGAYDSGIWFVEAALTRYNSIEYCDGGDCAERGSSDGALNHDYNANYVPPKYFGTLTLGARLLDSKLTLGMRAQVASERFGDDWDEESVHSGQVGANYTWRPYEVYDLFGSYEFNENNALNFSVENITDAYYYGALASGGIPSPGRTARISLTMKF